MTWTSPQPQYLATHGDLRATVRRYADGWCAEVRRGRELIAVRFGVHSAEAAKGWCEGIMMQEEQR